MPANNPVVNAIVQGARRRGLDPAAVLAVASVEGGHRYGAVGDGGHAFGPFQLNDAGGVLTNRPGNHAAFANSQAGIDFALDRIANVARGLHGHQAVAAIVRGFERPANIPAEIAKATSRYQSSPSFAPSGAALTPAVVPPPSATAGTLSPISPVAAQVLTRNAAMFNLPAPPIGLLQTLTRPQPSAVGVTAEAPAVVTPTARPRRGGPTIRFLEHFAAPYELDVTSTTGGKHVKNSWHYKGRAIDVAGDPDRMRAFAEAALHHPQDFKEMFYDPIGIYIKDGRVIRGAIGGHSDHVHVAA